MDKKTRRPWGEGSVSQTKRSGVWEIRISLRSDVAGKRLRIRRRVAAPNKKAALVELKRLQNRYGMNQSVVRLPTLEVYLESWLRRKGECLSEKSISNYRGLIEHVAPILGHVRIDLLEHSHITRLLDRLRAKGCGARTVQMSYDTLRAALNFAIKTDRILSASPMTSVPRPSHYYEMRYYDAEEAQRFLVSIAEDRLRALFHLVMGVGLRRGEILGLKWMDISFEGSALSVRRAMSEHGKLKTTKTKRSQRRVTLPQNVLDELRSHRDRMTAEGLTACELVFSTRSGTPIDPRSLYYLHFRPAMQRAGLRRIRFHDLRHTAATIRLAAGDQPHAVQEMLGHTKVETTLGVYGHVTPTMQRDSAALYDRIMAPLYDRALTPKDEDEVT